MRADVRGACVAGDRVPGCTSDFRKVLLYRQCVRTANSKRDRDGIGDIE